MATQVFPRKPYDEVESAVIRDAIRAGAFDDVEYRRYVNELVWLEWYTLDFDSSQASGISAFGCSVHRWRLAARLPEMYDRVREDLGASTRDDLSLLTEGSAAPEQRQRAAQTHHEEWQAVARGDPARAHDRKSISGSSNRRPFARFRFPILPYDTVQSAFIREETRRGSFHDLAHRRYVNKLVWIEWFATTDQQFGFPSPIARNWQLAAQHPDAYDIVRRKVDAEPRSTVECSGEIGYGSIDAEKKRREYKRAWRAVQER